MELNQIPVAQGTAARASHQIETFMLSHAHLQASQPAAAAPVAVADGGLAAAVRAQLAGVSVITISAPGVLLQETEPHQLQATTPPPPPPPRLAPRLALLSANPIFLLSKQAVGSP